jgi:hypothetical protein
MLRSQSNDSIIQDEYIFVIYPDLTKQSGEFHEATPLSEERLKWVCEVCHRSGKTQHPLQPNHSRIYAYVESFDFEATYQSHHSMIKGAPSGAFLPLVSSESYE